MLQWEEIEDSLRELYEDVFNRRKPKERLEYQELVDNYRALCKSIDRMVLAGIGVPQSYFDQRKHYGETLQTQHMGGEPCCRAAHNLPRDAKDFGY